MNFKPTHVYVARKQPCGCCVGLVTDLGDKDTGKSVGEMIGDGLAVTRESWETYTEKICKEETFMSCTHTDRQLSLMMENNSTMGTVGDDLNDTEIAVAPI